MKVTILGCGSSGGVPLVGCTCPVCTSSNPRNIRSRSSVLVENEGVKILIDTSPDLRAQSLQHNITKVDAIIFTHGHADHTHGIDDVRNFNYYANAPVQGYADNATLEELKQRFSYVFQPPKAEYSWFKACLQMTAINTDTYEPFFIKKIKVTPFAQKHGKTHSLGLRVGDFAYSTDVDGLPESSFKVLEGVGVWIVDCLSYKPAPTHAHLARSLEWISAVKPKRAVLTHMNHEFDYDRFKTELPLGVEPAYDGMVLEL